MIVPVLSAQITLAQPSVSTDANLRSNTWRFSIRWTPIASVIVTMAGSPSGIAATARLTAVRNISLAAIWALRPTAPRTSPMANTAAIATPHTTNKRRPT